MERRKWPSAVCFFFPIWRYSFPIQSSSLQNVSQQSHLNHRSLTFQWESQSMFGPFLWVETQISMVLCQTISRPCCTDRFMRGSRGSDCAGAVHEGCKHFLQYPERLNPHFPMICGLQRSMASLWFFSTTGRRQINDDIHEIHCPHHCGGTILGPAAAPPRDAGLGASFIIWRWNGSITSPASVDLYDPQWVKMWIDVWQTWYDNHDSINTYQSKQMVTSVAVLTITMRMIFTLCTTLIWRIFNTPQL